MNTYYDFSYFLRVTGENEATEKSELIKTEIKKRNGVVLEETVPLRRFLPYPIKKQKDGLFGNIKFIAEPAAIGPIQSALKMNDSVLRFLIMKVVKKENAGKIYKKRPRQFIKKEIKPKKQDEAQIAEIDKKLEELLGE